MTPTPPRELIAQDVDTDVEQTDLPDDPIGPGLPDPIEYEGDDVPEPQPARIVTMEFVTDQTVERAWLTAHGLIQSAISKGFKLSDGTVEDAEIISFGDE